MCVTAHPDDESAGFGGALMWARDQGAETSVVCLTDGQAATFRGDSNGDEELAAVRRKEFAAACEVLGVTHPEVLDYQDGKLTETNFYEIAGALVERIRRFRPQVLLTFGSEGGVNLHRDHTMASLATTAAFHWAGSDSFFPEQLSNGLTAYAPQKLYLLQPPFVAPYRSTNPEETPITTCSLEMDITEYMERKLKAFLMHTTQRAVLERVRDTFEKYAGCECYLLAASRSTTRKDGALFDGISDGISIDHAVSAANSGK
jgi:LmbE family N-acetylglucosaminyl deacetylase